MNNFKSMLLVFFLLFTSCSKKSATKQYFSHTMKLQKTLSISFKSSRSINFSIDPLTHSNAHIEVLAVTSSKEKHSLISQNVIDSNHLNFSPPKQIENYTYLIAIIKATDANGKEISNVDIYKIGEQSQINKAKAFHLSN